MRYILNPQNWDRVYSHFVKGALVDEQITVATSPISDNIFGATIEIPIGETVGFVDSTAEVLLKKYPWLKEVQKLGKSKLGNAKKEQVEEPVIQKEAVKIKETCLGNRNTLKGDKQNVKKGNRENKK